MQRNRIAPWLPNWHTGKWYNHLANPSCKCQSPLREIKGCLVTGVGTHIGSSGVVHRRQALETHTEDPALKTRTGSCLRGLPSTRREEGQRPISLLQFCRLHLCPYSERFPRSYPLGCLWHFAFATFGALPIHAGQSEGPFSSDSHCLLENLFSIHCAHQAEDRIYFHT